MKNKTVMLLPILSLIVLVVNGQNKPNYDDSVSKYNEILSYYNWHYHVHIQWENNKHPIESLTTVILKLEFYQTKKDSIKSVEQYANDYLIKQKLETKYHIKLP